jgi:hypothetical protein
MASTKTLFPILVLLFAFAIGSIGGLQKPNKLYLVKKTYVGEIKSFTADVLEQYLKQELASRGFAVVDDPADADAILTGSVRIILVLDGEPGDERPDTLRFKLETTSGEVIWKMELKVYTKWDKERDARFHAAKIVERIESDRKKSAKKAGVEH